MPSFTDSQEHFFGVELTKDKPTYTWSFNEEEEEEGDADFMVHTLFLKNAILGASAVKGERNLIQIETKNFEKTDVKQPFLSLTLGQHDMCNLDLSFGNETAVTFRLVEGNGPIAIGGQHLVEFPPDDEMSQDESALDDITEDDDEEEEEEEESPKKASKKRKAPPAKDKATKKEKRTESSADSEEEDEEESDEEEDMEEDEEPKKKKGKTAKGLKTTKVSPTKAGTKKGKKAGKK